MKKIFIFAAAALMSISAMATDLWTGSKHVSWEDGGLQIEAAKFSASATPKTLVVTLNNATGGIEFKHIGIWDKLYLHGFIGIEGKESAEMFLSTAALKKLSETGLEIIGDNFTVTKVELLDSEEPSGTLWKGFYWMEEWSTMTLKAYYLAGFDLSKYKAMRIYSEAGRTDYVINVLTKFDDPDCKLGDQTTLTMTNEYAELEITNEVIAKLEVAEELLIQCNKETGAPFNLTRVVLIEKETTGISDAIQNVKSIKTIENGQMVIIRDGVRYNALGAQL